MTENNESEQEVEATDKVAEAVTAETNSNDGDVLKQSERVITEMKKENDRKAKLIEREEKLLARQETLRALGGGSPAGQTPAKPAEKTSKEYAEEVMTGKIKAQ